MFPPARPSRVRKRADLLGRSALCGVMASLLGAIGATRVEALPVQSSGSPPQVAGGAAALPVITTTGASVTVATNANRTLINWTSYTVGSGESVNYTFSTRSDIALNVLTTSNPVQINGAINATVGSNVGGNVWFSAPGGVIFGAGSTVNVGGLLATTATIAASDFLNTGSSSFPFAFNSTGFPAGAGTPQVTGYPTSNSVDGVGGVTVESGATIQTHGGLLALIAPFVNVQSGANVSALDETSPTSDNTGGAGSVLYGAANAFIVSLATETSGDLDMLQFIISSPSEVTNNPLLLQGTTAGTNVYAAALSGSDVTGAVVDATGSITATQATAGQGGEIILSTAADTINAAGYVSNLFSLGSATNSGTLSTSAAGLNLANITSGRDQQISSSGDISGSNGSGSTLGTNELDAGGAITVSAASGAVTLDNVVASGPSATASITATVGAMSLGSVSASGGVSLTASAGVSLLGSVPGAPTPLSLQSTGGSVTIQAGGDITLTNAATANDSFTATATQTHTIPNVGIETFGTGGITATSVTAGGAIDLEGSSVYATSLTSTGAGVTAIAYPIFNGSGDVSYVDIGTAEAVADISLDAKYGYAALTAVQFNASGQTLSITTGDVAGADPLFLGYAQTAQGSGQQGQFGNMGGITYGTNGSNASINLSSAGPVSVFVNTSAALTSVAAGGSIYLNAQGALSVASDLSTAEDINVVATGALTLQNVTSTAGSVGLIGDGGVSFGAGSAHQNFTAIAISGSPGANSGAGTGTGNITATGDVTAANGYIDLEGTNVTVGNLTAGGVNTNNNDYIYAAAWGDSNSSPGTLTYTSTTPTYPDGGQVFLYPTLSVPPPPVTLPVQDGGSPPQTDANGSAPTIGSATSLSDGNTGETITLNAKRTLIDWTSYIIGSGGEVDYVFNPVEGQNAANARGNIVLNRITGGGPVDIEGALKSSVAGDSQPYGGNVWFSAPGGVIFGSGAVVNVGGLLATTAGFNPSYLQYQFLDPTVFTFTLLGAGTGYPSGATGYPFGTGYPVGGYSYTNPAEGFVGIDVEGGAQINAYQSFLGLLAPYVEVGSAATILNLDANNNGAASVLYAAAPSYTLGLTQPSLGGDTVSGDGHLDFGFLAISTPDLSGFNSPLDLEGTTRALNIYVAGLTPSEASSGPLIVTGRLTTVANAAGTGGEIILSDAADTITAGQTPTVSTAAGVSSVTLNLGNVTAASNLTVLAGGIQDSSNPANLLQAGGTITLTSQAGGEIYLANVTAASNLTVLAGGIQDSSNPANLLQAGGTITLTTQAGGDIRLATATSTGGMTITAPSDQSVGLGDLEATSLTGASLTINTAYVTVGTLTATAGAVSINTSTLGNQGSINIGPLNATGDVTLIANGDIQLTTVNAGGGFTATATTPGQFGGTYGVGAISATTITAGGSVDLEGTSVVATAITAGTANGAAGTITANADYKSDDSDAGLASVDIGTATAPGDISLYGNWGYASLTNVNFTGTGQTLTINAEGFSPITSAYVPAYFGYASGGPTANNGAGPAGGVGAVTGSGTINMTAEGAVNLNAASGSGLVTMGSVSAGDVANLTADALTITGVVQGSSGANATARTGDLTANELDSDFGDVHATATLGSVFLTTTTANNVYVTAAETAHVDNATTETQNDDPITITGATAYLGTGNSQDAINLTATNGNATAGDLTAQGAITIAATNGEASLHSATAGTPQSTYYDPNPSPTPITVAISATGTNADVSIGGANSSDVVGFITGATSITAQAARDVTVDVVQPIELNLVSAGRNATLTAPSLTLDSLQGTLSGALSINVTDNAFAFTSALTAGGSVEVSASGAINLTDVTAETGSVTLVGSSIFANAVTAGTANGVAGTITATASDPANSSITGNAFVDIGSVTAPGNITLTANDGYASLTSATFTGAGQTLIIDAFGPNSSFFPAYFGYAQGGPTANNGAGPTAGVGSATGSGTINMTALGDVDLNVASGTGLVTLGSVFAGVDLNGQGAVNLTADSLAITEVGSGYGTNVTARTGDLAATTLASNFGDVNATATQGSVFLTNTTGRNVYVTAAQTAQVDSATNGGVSFSDPIEVASVTGATAYLGSANSLNAINVTATNGNATAGDLTTQGAVTVTAANGLAFLHSATLSASSSSPPNSNTVVVAATGANGDVSIGGADSSNVVGFITGATSITAQAARDVTVDVDQPIILNLVSAGRNATLTAPSLTLDSLQGTLTGNIGIDVTAGGFADTSALAAGGGVNINATGAISLADVTAGSGGVSLVGAGISAGNIDSASSVYAATPLGGVSLGSVTAGTYLHVYTQGSFAATTITAGSLSNGSGSIDVRAGLETVQSSLPNTSAGITIGAATAGDFINLSAPGAVSVASATTSAAFQTEGYVNIAGGAFVSPFADVANYSAPDPSSITIGPVSAGADVFLRASGMVSVNSGGITAGGQIDLTSTQGAISATGLLSGNNIYLDGFASVTSGDLASNTYLNLYSEGSIGAGALRSGLSPASGVDNGVNIQAGVLNAPGAALNNSANITIGSISTPETANLSAPGAVNVGPIQVTSSVLYGDIYISGMTENYFSNLIAGTSSTYTSVNPSAITTGVLSAATSITLNSAGNIQTAGLAAGTNVNASVAGAFAATGSITGDGVNLTGATGVQVQKVASTSYLNINSIGGVITATGALDGDGVSLSGAAGVQVGNISSNAYIDITSEGSVSAGVLTAELQPSTGLDSVYISAGLPATATSPVNTSAGITVSTITALDGVGLYAPGPINVGSIQVTSAALDGSIGIGGNTSGAFSNPTSTTQNTFGPDPSTVTVGTLTAATTIGVFANGALNLGSVTAGGAMQVTSDTGALVVTGALKGGSVFASGLASVQLNGVSSDTSITIGSDGSITTGSLVAGLSPVSGVASTVYVLAGQPFLPSEAASTSAGVAINSITTPDSVSISAPGAVSVGSVVASSGGIAIGGAQSGYNPTPLTDTGYLIPSPSSITLGSVTVGGPLSLDTPGLASLGSVAAGGGAVISAGTLDITTLLSAPTLSIEARNGALTVGGSTAPTDGSLWISAADFSLIHATTALDLYAGSTAGTARGALVVSDLSINPAFTPNINLFAGPTQTVSVTGAVVPTVSGGSFSIGSPTNMAWTPSTILISGALGAATRVSDTQFTGVQAFQQVSLSSAGDVLIGSPNFFALIQATPAADINIGLNQPSGVSATGSQVGQVYVAAGQLNIDATGKVVQQNSSGSTSSYSGLYLLNGVSTAGTALSIDPPSVVDLFGSFVNASGVLTSGVQASRDTGLQVLGLPTGAKVPDNYRFNGCTISPSAACGGLMVGPEQGVQLLQQEQAAAAAAASASDPKQLIQPVLLTIAPLLQVGEQLDPLVTGVGNEEIWRKRQPGEGSDK